MGLRTWSDEWLPKMGISILMPSLFGTILFQLYGEQLFTFHSGYLIGLVLTLLTVWSQTYLGIHAFLLVAVVTLGLLLGASSSLGPMETSISLLVYGSLSFVGLMIRFPVQKRLS